MRHDYTKKNYARRQDRKRPKKPQTVKMHHEQKQQARQQAEQRAEQLTIDTYFAPRRRDVNRGGLGNWTTAARIIFSSLSFIVQHLIRFVKRFHFIFRTAAVRVILVRQPLVKAFEIAR